MAYTITPVDPQIPESYGVYTFAIRSTFIVLGGASVYVMIVPISGENTSGFEPLSGGVIEIPANGATVDVSIINDTIREGDQSFEIVVLSTPDANPYTDYLARSVFTIIDDDPYSTTDDFADSINDQASRMGAISVGGSVVGNLEMPGDSDFFRVTLVAGNTYSLGVSGAADGSGTLYDPYLALYNSAGTVVGYDDDSGSGNNALLNYTPTKSGDYYLSTTGFHSLGTGTYRVSLTGGSVPAVVDDYLGNGASPARISVGQTVNGNIETAGDKDWVGIVLQAGVTYSLALNAAASRNGTLYDPLLKLYDAHGVFLASNDDDGVGNNSLLQYTPTIADTYFIEASSAAAAGTGTYQIGVTSGGVSGPGTDDFSDSLTDIGSPKGSIAGQPVSGNIETAGDKDWFRADLIIGTTYSIALKGQTTADGTLYDPFVSLYSSTGVLLAFDDDNGIGNNALLQYTATVSDTFYIEARSASGAGMGTYQLTLSSPSTSSAADDFADSLTDTPMGAITDGQTRSGNVETGGDKDWFAVTLTAGTSYSIKLDGVVTGSGTLYDPFVSLYNSAGVLLVSNDDDGVGANSLLSYTPTTTGTCYVEARAFSSTATGTYQVGLMSGTGGGTGAGPGDDYAGTSATTGVVAAGQVVSGNVETAGDRDWFAITMTAGTTCSIALNAQVTGSGTLYDPFVTLYNSAGVLLASDDDSGIGNNSLLQYTATANGTYYIDAHSASASGTGTYQVGVTLAGGSAGGAGGGDDFAGSAATTGAMSPAQTLSGNIETAGDKDWFSITLAAGTSYSIALNGQATGAGTLYDPFVSLYNSAGTLLASNDDDGTGNNSLLQYTASATGTYYIEARSVSALGTGTYHVGVTASAANANDDYAASNATTGAIVAGQTIHGNIEVGGDKDWFAVTLAAGTSYSFGLSGQATASGTLFDPFVSVYNSAGVLLASNDDRGIDHNSLLQYVASSAGTYYVEARSFSASGTGTYELAMSSGSGSGGGPGGIDDYAGNSGTSGLLALGEVHQGNVETGADKDWFAITLAAGSNYSIALKGQASGDGTLYDPFVSLYNSAGVLLATDDDSGAGKNSLLQYAATASDTYYVEARGFNATATGTYHLEVDLIGVAVP